MNDKLYIVYKHTNKLNDKKYIGITMQEPNKRWLNGKGYQNNDYFNKSITKYGWDNFFHEVLYEHLTKEEAEQKEIELIAQYKSNQREFGYNIANGGNCVGSMSEETKKKISESHIGKPAWNKGLHIGVGESNSFYNKKHSEETKRKISLANKGRKKTLEQIEKLRNSCKETWKKKIEDGYIVSEETRKKISNANKGRVSTFKGHHHTKEAKEKLRNAHLGKKQSKEAIEKTAQKNRIPILCFDKEMNFINEFDSTATASKELNIYAGNITRALKNPNATAKGYKFKYKEKLYEEQRNNVKQ